MMYKMVREVYGTIDIFPAKPQYTFSTNNTVVYIFGGRAEDNGMFTLVSKIVEILW